MERAVEIIETEPDRARKGRMGDDEFRHLPRRHLSKINFPIRFEGAAGAKDRHPLDGIDVTADAFAGWQQDMVFDVEEPRGAIRALEQFADPNKIPAFRVRHGCIGNSLEKMRAGNDTFEKFVWTRPD